MRRIFDSDDSVCIPDEGVIDAFREIDRVGFVPTEETRYDDWYEETLIKAYVPIYKVCGFYADNTDPVVNSYDYIDEALSNVESDNPSVYSDSEYYDAYNDLMVEFKSVWVNENGDIEEEGESGLTNEDIDDCPLIQKILGKYYESIANCVFEAKGALKDEIRDNVQDELSKRFLEIYSGREYDYEGHIVYLDTKNAFGRKYTYIDVLDKETDNYVGVIKCRFANHSYNPANNSDEGAFISVVVNSNDPTMDKFNGRYNLRYGDEPDVDDILGDLENRMEDIMTYGEFLTRDGEDFYGV